MSDRKLPKINWIKMGGLIPAVAQDFKNKRVLMVGFMNKAALERTVREGKATYFSRTRRKLWTKGETSGNFQFVKQIFIDCDNDTILMKVRQIGPACHTGDRSCFAQTFYER